MGSSCLWEGTLSPSDFQAAARALSEKWEECNPSLPPWTWKHCPKLPWGPLPKVEGYLSLESVHLLKFCEKQHIEESGPASVKEEPTDNATLVLNHDNETHIYDFHVVYSTSYNVPVLYFRGYHLDGQPLERDDVERDLPLYSLKLLKESKWTFMTQEDHPYLNRPWYTLHPCGTSDWMKLLFVGGASSSIPTTIGREAVIKQYLVSWISVVGQAVGLKLPLEMQCKSSSSLM